MKTKELKEEIENISNKIRNKRMSKKGIESYRDRYDGGDKEVVEKWIKDEINKNERVKEIRLELKGRTEATQEFIEMIDDEDLLEKLADLEHQQFIHLIEYIKDLRVWQLCNSIGSSGVWNKQINSCYNKLSEEDKEKDRKFARLIIEELKQELEKNGNKRKRIERADNKEI